MKLLFSCNYAVIGDKSWKRIQIFSLPVLPRVILLDYLCYQLALTPRGIFIVWKCKSIAKFLCLCVCVIVPIYKKGDRTDCNNYRGISLLPTTYKVLSNILLSRLIPYAEEVIGDHQWGFRCNRSTTDHIFCIRQIL